MEAMRACIGCAGACACICGGSCRGSLPPALPSEDLRTPMIAAAMSPLLWLLAATLSVAAAASTLPSAAARAAAAAVVPLTSRVAPLRVGEPPFLAAPVLLESEPCLLGPGGDPEPRLTVGGTVPTAVSGVPPADGGDVRVPEQRGDRTPTEAGETGPLPLLESARTGPPGLLLPPAAVGGLGRYMAAAEAAAALEAAAAAGDLPIEGLPKFLETWGLAGGGLLRPPPDP
mmetsp:Transcript_9384/g.28213  ORF Transcript_9384/g.28213 Transcript_9384/m.28213 type:complete len:230 (-) Transcript_9384:842-1531(-)